MKSKAIISIHDISGERINEFLKIKKTLEGMGIKKIEYAVIIDAPKLSKEIKKLRNKDVCLHGINHSGNEKSLLDRLLFGKKYGHVAEFRHIKERTAKEKIIKMISGFRRNFHKPPKKFIPPRWEISNEAKNELKKQGIEETETIYFLRNLKTGKKIFSFICCFDFGDDSLMDNLAKLDSFLIIFLSKTFGIPLRFSIHPNDLYNGNFEFEMWLIKKFIINNFEITTTNEIWKNIKCG